MGVGSGVGGQLGMAQETTPGTAVSPTRFYEFTQESLQLAKTTIQGGGIHGGGLYNRASRRSLTRLDVNGSITMFVPMKGAGLLFANMLGSFATTATQIAATTAYKQVHAPAPLTGKCFTIQKGVPQTDGTVVPFTYVGCKFLDWTLSCNQGEVVSLQLTVDGMNELTTATTPAGPALATASYPTTGEFTFLGGNLTIGGTVTTTGGVSTVTGATTLAGITGANVKHAVALKTDRYYYGSNGVKAEQVQNGWRDITGSLAAEFVSRTAIYDAFRADSTVTLDLSFTGSDAGGGNPFLLDVLLPAVKFDGESPKVDSLDVVNVAANFTALDNQVDNPIQITYVSTDTAV